MWGGWLELDDARLAVPVDHQPAVPRRRAVRGRLPASARATSGAATSRKAPCSSDAPEARFVGCLLLFLASDDAGDGRPSTSGCCGWRSRRRRWPSAPLISFHRHHRSLEATWKYLLICSVGIALALLGNFFLAVAAARPGGDSTSMLLVRPDGRGAVAAARAWLKAAFILLLVGYGTKMGLAPLHTWLPDAHAEAPSVVSALLSGALLNCAFLGILRVHQVLLAGRAGGVRAAAAAGAGPVLDGVRRRVRDPPGRLQAAAGLLLGGAHGHPGARASGSAARPPSAPCSTRSTTRWPRRMLFLVAGNLLAAYRTKAVDQVSRRAAPALPVYRRAVARRPARDHRRAAVRDVLLAS